MQARAGTAEKSQGAKSLLERVTEDWNPGQRMRVEEVLNGLLMRCSYDGRQYIPLYLTFERSVAL
jgi:hypothetical protein